LVLAVSGLPTTDYWRLRLPLELLVVLVSVPLLLWAWPL
jgi:di/tricarboxylate transporter